MLSVALTGARARTPPAPSPACLRQRDAHGCAAPTGNSFDTEGRRTMPQNTTLPLQNTARGSGVLSGRFRRSTTLDESQACRRRVALAVTRAKQGDREALRFLYVQYADNVYGYVVSLVRD